jgi:hypothetical protein
MLTFGELKVSRIKKIAGCCPDSDDFRELCSDAVRQLLTRGNFFGSVQAIEACIYNECVVWPREVGTPLALNTCGQYVPLSNNWFRFVPVGPGGLQRDGWGWDGCNVCGNINGGDNGIAVVFNNVPCGQGRYIRAYPSVLADIGKTITIFGIDTNGQTIRTKDADGIWQEGVTLTLAKPFVSTPFQVREITRVLKEVTQGVVRLYQYDASADLLHDCAVYQPTEISPDYRTTKISNLNQFKQKCGSQVCNGLKSLRALVKLQHVPIEVDSDLVLIDNIDALALAIQAAKQSDGYDSDGSEKLMARAVHELNLQLRDKFPIEQTTISINPFGVALPNRHSIGTII